MKCGKQLWFIFISFSVSNHEFTQNPLLQKEKNILYGFLVSIRIQLSPI